MSIHGYTVCCAADYWRDPDPTESLRSVMARRNVFDPLEPTREPRWYTVRNMHGGLLESRLLPAGSDLKKEFLTATGDHIDVG